MYMNVNTHFPKGGPLHTVASLYSRGLQKFTPQYTATALLLG